MKLRHVRAVAIAVVGVVALTGARGSSGGGCSSHSDSSSSSSSGSGGHYGDDDVDVNVPDYDSGTTSGGATSDATSGSGGSVDAASDLDIESCAYEDARGLVATVTATNSSTLESYTYDFTVTFKDSAGATLTTADGTIAYVLPGQTDTQDVAAPYVPSADETANGTCEITDSTKTAE